MSSNTVNLKNPVLAALLAYLVPGLGHFYQGRFFKGTLYFVCILGTFFFGMHLGDGKVVYADWREGKRTWVYIGQFPVGLPALPALAQSRLRPSESLSPNQFEIPVSGRFQGLFEADGNGVRREIVGKIDLRPIAGDFGQRTLQGKLSGIATTDSGTTKVLGDVDIHELEPQVAPDPKRLLAGRLSAQFEDQSTGAVNGKLGGFILRPVWDSYGAPLRDYDNFRKPTDLDRAHDQLGGRFDLGVVFTFIAGLLNVLAIYDACQGPAYEDDEQTAGVAAPATRTA
ncbi:MAG: hypothetical protein HZA46_24675 [Planctomycetales bacterium]|nr:hypothetical protein [Planctomycetales bacterium]